MCFLFVIIVEVSNVILFIIVIKLDQVNLAVLLGDKLLHYLIVVILYLIYNTV